MSDNEKIENAVCFTGHRPEKLLNSEENIKKELEFQIRMAVSEGFTTFISGMARGTDIWAAQIILRLKSEYPIRLVCACPYEGFENGWKDEWKNEYRRILNECDSVEFTSKYYSRVCFKCRNEWMVNHSRRVIAVFNGSKGGTLNTINYARKLDIPIVCIKG